ncbi:PE family protein [Mycobacterium sp. Z3061]|uniref:PE family protein n=1 Tax=Mycobacterium sp. Z3061 TaxID=3073562 RepID=UPI00287379BD|nr:PE family protein [Mycobacterium sp. Z3061]
MQPMTFDPVVGDIGAQVVQIGISSLQAGEHAQLSITGLAPAGADDVSVQAVAAFHQEAASMLELHRAAQEELVRTGTAFTQIAQTYTDVDRSAADSVVISALPMSNPWAGE